MKTMFKRTAIRLITLPPLLRLMNRAINTAPIIFTLHRQAQPEFGIRGYNRQTIQQYLTFLRRHRYRTVTIDVIDAWVHGENDSDMTNTVAFTLDDGYQDQAELIRDVFLPMGVPVSMFLITDFIDGKDWPWDAKINWLIWNAPKKKIEVNLGTKKLEINLNGDEEKRHDMARALRKMVMYRTPHEIQSAIVELAAATQVSLPATPPACHRSITWHEARRLEGQGIRFGSHTVSHYVLSKQSDVEIDRQLKQSYQRIKDELKFPLSTLCYPFGDREDYSGRELLKASSIGYRSAVTTIPGVARKPRCQGKYGKYSINRYSLPDKLEEFIQYASWAQRLKEQLGKLMPSNYIDAFYGSRRGFLCDFITRINYKLGKYQNYQKVDWSKVKRLVFICKGNVCRSPFAEAVAKKRGLPALSYGLLTDPGTMVNPVASRVALQLDVDMTRHRSRRLDVEALKDGDLIIGMTPTHCDPDHYVGLKSDVQFTLLGLLNPKHRKPYLYDPYGLEENYFIRCLSYIKMAINAIELESESDSSISL